MTGQEMIEFVTTLYQIAESDCRLEPEDEEKLNEVIEAIQPKQGKLLYHFFPAFENTYKAKDDHEIKVKYDEFGIALITKELTEDWLKQFGYELIEEGPYKEGE